MNVRNDISEFLFLQSELKESDIIFIPGSERPENMEYACELYLKGYAPYLLPSGKYSILQDKFTGVTVKKEIYNKPYETECDFFIDIAKHYNIPDSALIKENLATYTMENADNSRVLTDRLGLTIKRAILCCKSFHARRAYMYYSLAYPETEFIIAPIDIDNITKNNWYCSEEGIDTVCKELEHIGTQFTDIFRRKIGRE